MSARSYFRDKSVLITGGSSGIGFACAAQVLKLGGRVTLVARGEDRLEAARRALLQDSPSSTVHVLPLDVADAASVEARVPGHLAAHPVDILFNNAGVVMPGRFLELGAHHFREMMDVNYFGAVHMCRVVLPHLVARGGGAVLNTSSMAGLIGIYGYTGYAASKFALLGFSEALRAEMWPHGVRVSACMPPDTDTPQLAFENRFKPEETRAIAGNVKTLSADAVATAMLEGVAAGEFAIVPGADATLSWWLQRLSPGLVRWVCDRSQKRASSTSRSP